MIVLHGLKACDTCRKALKWLREAGRDVRLRDLREEPPTEAEIARWQAALGPALLNTRSTTWRGLDEAERVQDPETLLVTHPALIKRPVIEDGDALHLGWTSAVQAKLTS